MGEMADMALEEVCAHEHLIDQYTNGHMSDQEAYEYGIIDESGYFDEKRAGEGFFGERIQIHSCDELDDEINNLLRQLGV